MSWFFGKMSCAWQSVDDIQSHMLNFLENHDEQRIASKFFAGDAEKGKNDILHRINVNNQYAKVQNS